MVACPKPVTCSLGIALMSLSRCLLLTFAMTAIMTATANAAIVTYDASSGLLPQSVGWVFSDLNNPSATVSVGGGVLTLESALANRAYWELTLTPPGTPGGLGAFVESTLKVISETHNGGTPVRGLNVGSIGHSDGITGSVVDVWIREDRIFVNDSTDTVVATYFMDTTDAFHAYRIEILDSQFWLFVDGSLKLSGTTPVFPYGTEIVVSSFGDASGGSENLSEWKTVTVGSLPDIGGPTLPEPSSMILAACGATGFIAFRRRNAGCHC